MKYRYYKIDSRLFFIMLLTLKNTNCEISKIVITTYIKKVEKVLFSNKKRYYINIQKILKIAKQFYDYYDKSELFNVQDNKYINLEKEIKNNLFINKKQIKQMNIFIDYINYKTGKKLITKEKQNLAWFIRNSEYMQKKLYNINRLRGDK